MDRLFQWADGLGRKKTFLLALAGAPVVILLLFLTNKFIFSAQEGGDKPTITGSLPLEKVLAKAEANIGEVFYLDRPGDIIRFDDGGESSRAGIAYLRPEEGYRLKKDPLAFSYLLLENSSTPAEARNLAREAKNTGGWSWKGDGWMAYAIPGQTYKNFPALFLVADSGSVYARLIVDSSLPSDKQSQEKLLELVRLR